MLRKAGIFAGVDLVLVLPLFFFICKSLPDEFLITLETKTPEELSLYLKTADNPEFSEKVRLKKDIPAGKIITWKQQLPEGTQIDNIRLDLGTKPEKITIREIALQRYGFLKQTPDLAQAQKIFSKHRVTRFAVKDGVVTLSSNYNPYLISLKKEFTKSLENSFVFTGIAVWFLLSQLLLLFLLSPYGIGVWRQLCQYHLWEKVKSQRRLLRKAGIFAGVDLVLILPLFFFICKSLPDEFLLTLETQTPEELSLYLKTPSNPEFSEKVRLRKEVPAGKITTWKQQLPDGTQIDSFRFDLGTKPEKMILREVALLRYGFLKQTPDLAQAEKIFIKHRVTRFAVKDGVVTLSSNYNPYLISLKKEFAKSLENSFVFTGIAVWFLLSQLLLLLLFRYGRELLLVLKTFDLSAQIRKHRKLLKNTAFFVGLNIIILGMVWSFLIPELPDFFSISLASNKADAVELFIQTADDRSYSENNKLLISHSGNNKKDTCTVRLPAGVLTGNIRIDFGSIPKELRIRDISVYTNGVFRQRLDLSKAVDVYTIKHHIKTFEYDGQEIFIRTENNDPFIIPNAKSFAVAMVSDGISSVACGVWAVFEICLLLLIVFGPELWKKNCFAPRENLLQSTVCALCFSALIMLLIPVYTLRSNHENFACSVTELLLANLPEFFLLFFVLTAVLFLLRRILNYVPHMLMLGITVYIFLETGLLSIGLPALNGDLSGYGIISRSVWDTAVLLLLLLLPCIFVKTLKQWSHWICLIVLVMSLLSCIEAKKSVCQDHGDMIIKEMLLRRNVIDSVRYSAQKNVMMFILDSISTEVLEEVLQKNPDIAALFPGFVCYRDNIGMHQQTSVALPGIMTGKYCEDFGKLASYTLSTYGKESFLKDYLEADVPVYVNLGISDVASYTNRLSAVGGKDKDIGSIDPMQQRIPGMLVWSLKEICWFRMTPYILKKTVLARIIAGWKQNYFSENLANDEVLCRHLLQKLPDAKEPLVLNVHHTNGSHLPFIFGPNGEMRAQSDATWQGYYEQSCYILKLLGGLLSHYQKLGIYDKATIIVCADHGLFSPRKQNTRLPQVPGTAFPFLMIKPAARTASLQFSDLPVSHNKIAMLVRKLYKQDLSQQEVEETLKSSQRLYRQFSGTQNMDYIIDDKGGFQKVVRNAEQRDASEFAPLVLNKKYSLKIFGNTEYPDFFCQNMVRTGGNGLDILSTIGEIKLKAPAPDRKYVVEFSAFTFVVSKQHYKGKYMFRDMIRKDAPRITADKAVPFRNARVCIPVVSDSKGVIRLQVDGRDTNYFLGLEHLILSEQGAQQ